MTRVYLNVILPNRFQKHIIFINFPPPRLSIMKKIWLGGLILLSVLFLSGCSAAAKTGDTVLVDYTGRLEDGTVFDSSAGKSPIEFVVGGGLVIPGFDVAVKGMKVGEEKNVAIQPEAAYGVRDEAQVFKVPRDKLPQDREPEVGAQLRLTSKAGEQNLMAVITEVAEKEVTADANHPLAGKTLFFAITLKDIKK